MPTKHPRQELFTSDKSSDPQSEAILGRLAEAMTDVIKLPGGDVLLTRLDDEPEENIAATKSAPVADLRLADIAPATGDIGGAEHSSDTWRLEFIPQLEHKLAAAKARAADAENTLAVGELSLALGHDGAEANLAELRERQRLAEIEANGLLRAIKRAEAELKAAERREAAVAAEKRIARAEQLVHDRVSTCAAIDGKLRELAALAEALNLSTLKLNGFTAETGVHMRRMRLSGNVTGAIWHAGEALATLLDLPRGQPLTKMRPLVETEAGLWSRFCPVDIPDAGAAVAVPRPNIDPDLGRYGAEALQPLPTGAKRYEPGDIIPGSLCLGWPLKNRVALQATERVRFLAEGDTGAVDGKIAPHEPAVAPASPPAASRQLPAPTLPTKTMDPVASAQPVTDTVGQHGAIALQPLDTGGMHYAIGDTIPGAVVASWPKRNRDALARGQRIQFLDAPQGTDDKSAVTADTAALMD